MDAADRDSIVYVRFGAHGNDHARRVAAYLAAMPDVHFVEPLGPTQYHLAVAKLDIMSGAKAVALPATLNGNGQTGKWRRRHVLV